MHAFRVWAPAPKKVEIEVNGARHPMHPDARGWWQADLEAGPGADYGFWLDGQGPFPDPRSPSQPGGIHDRSRIIDHATFKWTDETFKAPLLTGALIYELHIGTFTATGTFLSAVEKLDELVKLGVTHVELMPVNEFSGEYGWGYDGVDLFAPHHAYGTPDELKSLVSACHARGLAVILDVVYNHLGPSGNYLGKFGPYFTKKFATFWGEGINFDGPDSGEVRRFFCDNALMWLRDYHFDGLRLDAVHGIIDTSATHFLEQLKVEVEALAAQTGRPLVLIPESDLNDPRLLWARERGGYALDAQWSDDFHHALHAVLTGEKAGYYEDFGRLEQLAKALQRAYIFEGDYSPHRRRVHGRPADGLSGHRFLGYLQNHDQVGNRARGERTSQLLSPGRLKIGAALVLTAPFIPMLFQGEEWGASTPFNFFTNHQDPELAQAVREGRRREFAAFGWKPEEVADPQARATFVRSILNWQERNRSPHAEILDWHQRLIQLRRKEPALTDGARESVRTAFDEAERWLTVKRGAISVACNFSDERRNVPLPSSSIQLVLASESGVEISGSSVSLPAESVAILKTQGVDRT
jgi:maltooligosyltrehalose trehalohydrolase